MRVKIIDFEGSADEFPVFAASQAELIGTNQNPKPALQSDHVNAITPDEVRHIFTRLPLSNGQRAFLTCIHDSGDKGALASEVRDQAKITPAQFAGVLGAFGRRITNTFDNRKFSLFEDIATYEWESDQYRYWLTEPVRQAIEEFDLL